MTRLIDTGPRRIPTWTDIIKARDWGRTHFGCCEDKWEAAELAEVRKHLPAEWQEYDLFKLKNLMMLSRKNKLKTTRKDLVKLARRLNNASKAYSKEKSRRKTAHSKEYLDRIDSPEWGEFTRELRERCNFRCQLCGRRDRLDGHHTPEGYSHLSREQDVHVMALCRRCHDLADLLREVGGLERSEDSKRMVLLSDDDLSQLFDIELVGDRI